MSKMYMSIWQMSIAREDVSDKGIHPSRFVLSAFHLRRRRSCLHRLERPQQPCFVPKRSTANSSSAVVFFRVGLQLNYVVLSSPHPIQVPHACCALDALRSYQITIPVPPLSFNANGHTSRPSLTKAFAFKSYSLARGVEIPGLIQHGQALAAFIHCFQYL